MGICNNHKVRVVLEKYGMKSASCSGFLRLVTLTVTRLAPSPPVVESRSNGLVLLFYYLKTPKPSCSHRSLIMCVPCVQLAPVEPLYP